MKKNHEVRFKVSQEDLEKLKKRAEKIGLTVSAYVRFLSLSTKITTTIINDN